MTEPIKVRYSYTLESIEDVSDAVDKRSPSARRARIEAVIAGCLFLVAPFLAANSLLRPDAFLLMLSPAGIPLIWCGMQTPQRYARQRYSQAVEVWSEVDVVIDHSGILMHTRAVPGELIEWDCISQSVEGRMTAGLVARNIMLIFPRKAFSSEQWAKFMKLVRERVHPY